MFSLLLMFNPLWELNGRTLTTLFLVSARALQSPERLLKPISNTAQVQHGQEIKIFLWGDFEKNGTWRCLLQRQQNGELPVKLLTISTENSHNKLKHSFSRLKLSNDEIKLSNSNHGWAGGSAQGHVGTGELLGNTQSWVMPDSAGRIPRRPGCC